MPGRIVLFGATGYTGRLTAEAMVERGLRPVLAARNRDKVERLAAELGGLEARVADVDEPPTVRALVERGDVLVTTVGPFVRWGNAAAAAATDAGAHYLDSTGEPGFVREVFERYGVVAERQGCGMLTSFGYDWVPGNLAGAIALERAGERATRVDVGYFVTGPISPGSMSKGTAASGAGILMSPGWTFRDGGLRSERVAARRRSFRVDSKARDAVSWPGSEHFALPRVAPQLEEVGVYLGWFGPASKALPALSAGTAAARKLPGCSRLADAATRSMANRPTSGPDEQARSQTGSHIVAVAYDSAGSQLAEVHVSGVNGYTFTGRILAWGAGCAAAGGLQGSGALGPVDGFGLDALRRGCEEAGITEQGAAKPASESVTPATA
jgi:short subunit dehydrogenase-like uncharacterized protein